MFYPSGFEEEFTFSEAHFKLWLKKAIGGGGHFIWLCNIGQNKTRVIYNFYCALNNQIYLFTATVKGFLRFSRILYEKYPCNVHAFSEMSCWTSLKIILRQLNQFFSLMIWWYGLLKVMPSSEHLKLFRKAYTMIGTLILSGTKNYHCYALILVWF